LCSHGDNRGERRETEKRKAAGVALHASCSTLTVEPSLGNTWNRCKQDDVAHAVPRGGCQGLERVLREQPLNCVHLLRQRGAVCRWLWPAPAFLHFPFSLPLLPLMPLVRQALNNLWPAKDAAQQSKQSVRIAVKLRPLVLSHGVSQSQAAAPRPSGAAWCLGSAIRQPSTPLAVMTRPHLVRARVRGGTATGWSHWRKCSGW
jgi:hypothetical protein